MKLKRSNTYGQEAFEVYKKRRDFTLQTCLLYLSQLKKGYIKNKRTLFVLFRFISWLLQIDTGLVCSSPSLTFISGNNMNITEPCCLLVSIYDYKYVCVCLCMSVCVNVFFLNLICLKALDQVKDSDSNY